MMLPPGHGDESRSTHLTRIPHLTCAGKEGMREGVREGQMVRGACMMMKRNGTFLLTLLLIHPTYIHTQAGTMRV